MTDTLLRSLREHMLDESEPLAGLLRKCLLLAAETGSDSLREWARRELNGYRDEEQVPDYRTISGVPISMDSVSGNTWARNQMIDRLQVPQNAREYVPEDFNFRQPVEELELYAERTSLSFSSPGLGMAQMMWNRELGPFQSIMGLSYLMTGSTVAGILGQIRTKLVDLIADLTSETPLSELPKKDRVDAAVIERIGPVRDVYNTTIHAANGPTAVGARAKATTEGLSVEDALRMLGDVQRAATDIDPENRAELEGAIADLRVAVEQDRPDTGDVVKKVGKLHAAAERLGVASISAATGGAAQAFTELAVSGAFG